MEEPWEAFGPVDPSQRSFEARTKPTNPPAAKTSSSTQERKTNSNGSKLLQDHVPPDVPNRRDPSLSNPSNDRNKESTIYSKLKSTLGITSDYRDISQSDAVIARITAVRAARLSRYHDKNPANVSYRQRSIDRESMQDVHGLIDQSNPAVKNPNVVNGDPFADEIPGYRFYTHGDLGMSPTTVANTNEDCNNDDHSLSTNSNAVDYAANLAVD
jgi:hypothetical protein